MSGLRSELAGTAQVDRRPRSLPEVSELRAALDTVDTMIVRLLAERFDLVEEIAAAKRRAATGVRDVERERHVLDRAAKEAGKLGLPFELVHSVFRAILDHSVAHQVALEISADQEP